MEERATTTVAPTTTAGPTAPTAELGATTTTTPEPPGVGVLAGPTTIHGFGLGELQVNDLPDLGITGMEITQGIQNLDNDMPLVADRTTVLRVYMQTDQTDGEGLANVSGLLQLVRNGTDVVAIIEPDNGPLAVGGDPPDRLDVDGSLNFTLPVEAIGPTSQGDRLIATAFVFSTHPSTPADLEPTDVNNFEAEVFDFHHVGGLKVHLLPMHVHEVPLPTAPDATYGTSPTDFAALVDTLTSLYRYHPVAGVIPVMGPTVYPPLHGLDIPYGMSVAGPEWDLSAEGVEASILGQIEAVWAETTPTDSHLEQYYGIYRQDLPKGWGGYSNGIVAYGFYGQKFGDSDGNNPWYHNAGWLAAHELGHSMGFDHVGCNGNESDPGSYPWSDPCTLAPVDPAGYYGWDIRHDAFEVTDGPTVISQAPGAHPANGYPYMGYQSPKWTDPWHYCRALVKFNVPCAAVGIPENEIGPTEGPDLAATQPYEPESAYDGWIELNSVTQAVSSAITQAPPSIVDAHRVDEPLPHVLEAMAQRRSHAEPSGVIAAVVDADGDVLAELELVDSMHGAEYAGDLAGEGLTPPASTTSGTTDYLPWFEDAVAVQLRVDGAVVDERRASANSPTVAVTSPAGGDLVAPFDVTWQASDADGDELVFDIAFSPDGGATWTGLANAVRGSTYTMADTSLLAGGDQAIFRVTARDGLHATPATSVPAVLADQPPWSLVLSPADGTTVPMHSPVTLLASVADPESGATDVVWTSSLDGSLGAGSQLVARALSAGEHVLTASVRDAAGGTSSASVTITVDAATALPRLDADGYEAAVAALGDGPVDVDRAERAAGGGSPVSWSVILVGAIALLAAGLAVRRGRASRSHSA